jgi:serralysin
MSLISILDIINDPWTRASVAILQSRITSEALTYYYSDVSTQVPGYQDFALNLISKIDSVIDLDFVRVENIQNAAISFQISDWSGQNNAGLAYTKWDDDRPSIGADVFLKKSWGDNFNNQTFIHEFGHVLGLAHPGGNGSNESWDQDDTTMSYIASRQTGLFNTTFTSTDWAALKHIWGQENDIHGNSLITIQIDSTTDIVDFIKYWLPNSQLHTQTMQITNDAILEISASTWSGNVQLIGIGQASKTGGRVDAYQIDFANDLPPQGSLLAGDTSNDQIFAKAGWDVIDGGAGNDLIRAGNGRDIITGGAGADELHGDFGWNTYRDERDGSPDLIAIKSDQYLYNWVYGKAGNSPNGEKADIIEGLDAIDRIKIIGANTSDITVRSGATAHGVSGIGIYAKGALEALYIGGNLSASQISGMTTGDASATAMSNSIDSYGVW